MTPYGGMNLPPAREGAPFDDSLSAYGFHRVKEPHGALPQGALRVDSTPSLLRPDELLLDVDFLMLDATSMKQIRESCSGNEEAMRGRIAEIVADRGKMHNPVTNSGGVMFGRVREIGPAASRAARALRIGEPFIPVASLSTLPLSLGAVREIKGDRVYIDGVAVMFACMKVSPIPSDFTAELALACIDISSLVPQVRRSLSDVVRKRKEATTSLGGRDTIPIHVLVQGCGKAGLAALYCIRDAERAFGGDVKVRLLAMDYSENQLELVRSLGLADTVMQGDARDARELFLRVHAETSGALADLVINVVNVRGTENATVLATRGMAPHGTVLFFSMATHFDQAALATDSLGRDVTMIIGNGVAENQVEETFDLIRSHKPLRTYFESH